MNKKKLFVVLSILVLLFVVSGCSIPTDEQGNFIQITNETTFQNMMDNEGFFSAIFVYPLSKLINIIAGATGNVGLAILIITVAINAIILVLTLKQNIAMQRMQAIQPELERIQRKYEGREDQASKMRMAQEMQNLYSKNKINPLGSMLVMFIQFPVIIAMYHAVQRSQAVATGTFLGISLELTPIEGIQNGQFTYIILFGLMLLAQVGSMLLPQKLAQRRAKMEAEKHHRPYRKTSNPMQSSMYIMMAVVLLLGVTWPTAMSFYWMISSCVNIVKTIIVDAIGARRKEA